MANSPASGPARAFNAATRFNAYEFVTTQLINKVVTMKLVQVIAVNPAKQTVDIQPLVNLINGNNQPTAHGIIHIVPYQRIKAGGNEIILTPVVGDIGRAVVADRDISSVKATRGAVSNPASKRKYNLADATYDGSLYGPAATQTIDFTGGNITVTTPGNFIVSAAEIITTGVLMNNGKVVGSTHEHTGVQTGASVSGPPV